MKINKFSALLWIMLLGFLMESCDTTLNVKSPNSSYFIKYFGKEGSQTGADFVIDKDGTFILFGTTQKGAGDPHFYIVKVDELGNVISDKIFGSGKCQARDIELTSDGRIVVLGNIIIPGKTDFDLYAKIFTTSLSAGDSIIKGYLDKNTGQPVDEDASSITETNDGFIIAGSSGNLNYLGGSPPLKDALFVRLNSDLSTYTGGTWPNIPAYGQATENYSTKIVQRRDLGFDVFGYTRYNKNIPPYSLNFWYFGLSSTGTTDKGVNYSPEVGKDHKLFAVAVDTTSLGKGFFLAGLEIDPSGDRLYFTRLVHPPFIYDDRDFLVQPNFLGIDLGQLNTVLNPPRPSNEFVSVCSLKSSGYLLLTNEVTSGNNNLFLTKISSTGNLDWNTPILYGGQGDDFSGTVQELPDGRIVIIGTMTIGQASVSSGETKMVLIKVNKDGLLSE